MEKEMERERGGVGNERGGGWVKRGGMGVERCLKDEFA